MMHLLLFIIVKWVIAEGECYFTPVMRLDEAKRCALNKARSEAIIKALGIIINARTMDISGDIGSAFTSITQGEVYGKIVEEKILKEGLDKIRAEGKEIPVYKVKIKANVKEEKGKPDPNFKVKIELNKHIFRDRDEIIVKVKSTKDCYITLLNFLSNDTVIVLFPNELMTDNFIEGGKMYEIPPEDLRNKGVKFKVGLPADKYEAVECIGVIATKKNYRLGEIKGLTHKETLIKLNKWLITIPLDERTSDYVIYKIIK